MTFIVSLVIGIAAGLFLNYAVTLRSGRTRYFILCVVGGLVGGWIVPAIFGFASFWAAVICAILGVLVLLALWMKFAPTDASGLSGS